jgi:hypothetical protein
VGFKLKDANLKGTLVLPNGNANASGAALDLGLTAFGDFVAQAEFLLTAPALTTTEQPDAKTLTYDIIQSDNADLSSPVALYPGVLVQTGAGGAGAAGGTFTFRVPVDVKRYVGVKATGSAAGNSSTKSATLEALL